MQFCVDCKNDGSIPSGPIRQNRCGPHRELRQQNVRNIAPTYFVQVHFTGEMREEAQRQRDAYNDLLRRAMFVKPDASKFSPEEMAARQEQQYAHHESRRKFSEWLHNGEIDERPKLIYLPRILYTGPTGDVIKQWRQVWLPLLKDECASRIADDFRVAWKAQFRSRGGLPQPRKDLIWRFYYRRSGDGQGNSGWSKEAFLRSVQWENEDQTMLQFGHLPYEFVVRTHRSLYPYDFETRIKRISATFELSENIKEGDIINGSLSLVQEYKKLPYKGGLTAIVDRNHRKHRATGNWLEVLIPETGEFLTLDRELNVRVSSERRDGRIDVNGLAELDSEISKSKNVKDWETVKLLSAKKREIRSRIAKGNRWVLEGFWNKLWKMGVRVVFFEDIPVKAMIEDKSKKKGTAGVPYSKPALGKSQKYRQMFMPFAMPLDIAKSVFERGRNGESGAVEVIAYMGSSSTCCYHENPTVSEPGLEILEYSCGCRRHRGINATLALTSQAAKEFSQTYPQLEPFKGLRKSELKRRRYVEETQELTGTVA